MNDLATQLHSAVVSGMFTLVASLTGALLALFGVALTAFFTSRNNNKNVFINTVTVERAKWRTEMRNTIAEFCRVCYEQLEGPTKINIPKLQELRILTKLRLNPDQKHELDAAIMVSAANVIDGLVSSQRALVISNLQILENKVQELLKQEWDKSKTEAKTGKVTKTKECGWIACKLCSLFERKRPMSN
ncbi:hypothetical protein [Oryzomonas rubra]|uniref:Uncharacterized protein n=1 Tax=Oryzomonas rubra TaxID=2509454 RepID=A0A5A9XPC0_9BACT|nr:hypothetical protein [Oryzomonas rubra]KAA0893451.1 hypothetical protein ET418_06490 [Oryzomonas rubra]